RRSTRRLATSLEVAEGMSMIISCLGSPAVGCRTGSWPSPGPAVAGEHLVGGGRAPAARDVRLRTATVLPARDDRVEDLPGQLDLLLPREQRGIAEQHVEDEPFVCLRARLGER